MWAWVVCWKVAPWDIEAMKNVTKPLQNACSFSTASGSRNGKPHGSESSNPMNATFEVTVRPYIWKWIHDFFSGWDSDHLTEWTLHVACTWQKQISKDTTTIIFGAATTTTTTTIIMIIFFLVSRLFSQQVITQNSSCGISCTSFRKAVWPCLTKPVWQGMVPSSVLFDVQRPKRRPPFWHHLQDIVGSSSAALNAPFGHLHSWTLIWGRWTWNFEGQICRFLLRKFSFSHHPTAPSTKLYTTTIKPAQLSQKTTSQPLSPKLHSKFHKRTGELRTDLVPNWRLPRPDFRNSPAWSRPRRGGHDANRMWNRFPRGPPWWWHPAPKKAFWGEEWYTKYKWLCQKPWSIRFIRFCSSRGAADVSCLQVAWLTRCEYLCSRTEWSVKWIWV